MKLKYFKRTSGFTAIVFRGDPATKHMFVVDLMD